VTQALVGVETVLLALLGILVAGILRSHAEILRRLEGATAGPLPAPLEATGDARAAPDIEGATPSGGVRRIAMGAGAPNTLVAFLTSGCTSCRSLLADLEHGPPRLPSGTRLVVVTKDRAVERVAPFRQIQPIVDVVMSSRAWTDYRAPGSPYFAYTSGGLGLVAGEGSATTWEQVVSLLVDALDDARDQDDSHRIDSELAAAGIGADHPSLRPSTEAMR
jgi:hypothetical protein